MYTIHLHNLEFFSFHGLHREEAVLGNRFVVSMDVATDIKDPVHVVQDTVDYSVIYGIIKKHMLQPLSLLEQVAAHICDEVLSLDKRINSASITIKKMNAPISRFKGEVGVTCTKKR